MKTLTSFPSEYAENAETKSDTKILLLTANPHTDLPLENQAREIELQLLLSRNRDQIQFVHKGACRPRDASFWMDEFKPDIVHLSGHCDSDGSFLFQDDRGRPHPVGSMPFSRIFSRRASQLRLVVFDACNSERLAFSASRHVPYSIGTNAPITAKAAEVFFTAFYGSLGQGSRVEKSFYNGADCLAMEGSDEYASFLLHTPGGLKTGAS